MPLFFFACKINPFYLKSCKLLSFFLLLLQNSTIFGSIIGKMLGILMFLC